MVTGVGVVVVVSVAVGGGGVAVAAGERLKHQRLRVVKRAFMAGGQGKGDDARPHYIDSVLTISRPVFVLVLGVSTRS